MNLLFEQHVWEALQQGRFSFAYGLGPLAAIGIAIALALLVCALYWRTTRSLDWRWKTGLITVRVIVVLLLFLILLRPTIRTEQVEPQETYLAVLIDDSQSMSIADAGGGRSRQQVVRDTLLGQSGELAQLAEQYELRRFRFDTDVSRLLDNEALAAGGSGSDLGQALSRVAGQLQGLPLAGVVLVSDGADNVGSSGEDAAAELGARDVPVFTLGVGEERIPRDIGIVDVAADKTILEGSVFNVAATVTQRGYADEQVTLRVLDGDEVVESRAVRLGPDGATRRFELEISPERREPILYELQIQSREDEVVTENNRYRFLVDNSERDPLDILYVDGHPRNEYKFIRRAATGDDSIRLASYLETGPGRYYRQGIESPLELSDGFPDSREALFEYEALLIGDIGPEFLTDEQLQLIRDFVGERGGGLIVSGMLNDQMVDTPLAEILPVTLVRSTQLPGHLQGGITRGDHATGAEFSPRLTREGELSPILRLASEDAANRQSWQELADLQGVYVTGRPKPGATVLLEHPSLQYRNDALPVIATQRYGSGRSMAITTASTWRWQMLMDSSDESHQRLWRQMLRWSAVSSPQRISFDFDRELYNAGDTVEVSTTVRDARYEPDDQASVWLQHTAPSGETSDIPMEWDADANGVYRARFTVQEEGVHGLVADVTGAGSGDIELTRQASLAVTPPLREFTSAGRDSGLLERIAEASGGGHAQLNESGSLLGNIQYTPNAYSQEVEEDIWDRPGLLALLILMLCGDWALRRQKGLS